MQDRQRPGAHADSKRQPGVWSGRKIVQAGLGFEAALHGSSGGLFESAGVAVPDGEQGVARELHDVAAMFDDEVDQEAEVDVETAREVFRANLATPGQRLGEGGEAGNVGKKSRAGEMIRAGGLGRPRVRRKLPDDSSRNKARDARALITRHVWENSTAMRRCFDRVSFFFAVLAALAGVGTARAEFPKAQGYLADTAHVLDEQAKAELVALLQATEQQTTAEIAVATVSSLDGMSVEEYANKLFREWGVGKKGHDNGVLVLVAPTERKMRIEVGYGLEPILPDGLAGEVIRNNFTPAFKSGDYSKGITEGVQRVAAIVRANQTLSPEERRRFDSSTSGDRPPMLLMIPFFGLFVGMGAFAVGIGLRSKTGFPLIWGAMFGGIPMLMALVPFFNAPMWALLPLAAVMGVWGYSKGASTAWVSKFRTPSSGGSSSSSSGWVMGSNNTGGRGSSGGGGGGGFGGGSSGGGGASGSW
jgi:uncharacterized protein